MIEFARSMFNDYNTYTAIQCNDWKVQFATIYSFEKVCFNNNAYANWWPENFYFLTASGQLTLIKTTFNVRNFQQSNFD